MTKFQGDSIFESEGMNHFYLEGDYLFHYELWLSGKNCLLQGHEGEIVCKAKGNFLKYVNF